MKKQLLFMCALCMSAVQAWAQPARAVHPPVKAEKLHRISPWMPGDVAWQGSSARQAADSRAGESDTLLSVVWEESAFPITLPNTVPPYTPAPAFPWSGDYAATLTIVNEGSDFSGDLQIMLYRYRWNAGGEASHRSDATRVTLPRGATQRVTFTGRIEGSLPIDYIYTVQLIEQGGKVLDTKPYRASVVYPLAVVAEGTMLPRSMDFGEEHVYTVRLRNEGNLDVSTNIVLQFLDLETKGLAGHGDMVAATIPRGGTADVPIHVSRGSNVNSLCEGSSYQMEVGFVEDRTLYPVAFEDDSTGHVVEVHGYDLVLANDTKLPATIRQHTTDTLSLHLLNRGDRDFNGYMAVILVDADGNPLHMAYPEGYRAQVAAGEEACLDIRYNIRDADPGNYYLMIAVGENTPLYGIPTEDNPTFIGYPVEVVYQPGPQLTVLYGQSSFPAEVVQNHGFEVTLAIANTGEAAYEGEVWLELCEEVGVSRHSFDTIPVILPTNDTVNMPFALTADIDLPGQMAETLYWRVGCSLGGGLSETIAFDDPAWPSPASTIVLLGEKSSLPSPGDGAFSLYPNPATDRLTVTAPSGIGRVRLYSPCGTLVLDEPCGGHATHDLRLGTLPPGIYLLQATTPEGIRTGRVVKR